jgi:pyruvate/2-oxoacid:ferredoxin oxidoreductase beta subunit/Pyruvate/2-oxoacid:ferredoxin oxidoreductase gamma subunit
MSQVIQTSYMTDQLGPLPFCPGCGHERLVKDLDKALVKMQLDPKKVVIVTDIGCIGLADRYFTTNAFHGLHGRSLTYATGLKLARPELTVIVLMGDGGCGIGGTHLLNAARRNVDLTLLVANNFNYGMTGGQHSVTTPVGSFTATTPAGNIEGAMDLCATAAGAGAGWVFRGLGYDADIDDRIVDAINHPGFAMLDIWELCTAYYMPRNEFNKKELYNLVESSGFETGLLVEKLRPEFGARYRNLANQQLEKPTAAAIEKCFDHNITRQTGLVIAGSAGQKIRSTAELLARAAMLCGLSVTQKDDYPITVMTGHSISEINLSNETIEYTAIDTPDYFLVLSEDGLKKTRGRISNLTSNCLLIIDEGLDVPSTEARLLVQPISQLARKAGRFSNTMIALSILIQESSIIPADALQKSVSRYQSQRAVDSSLEAMRLVADRSL